MMMIRSYSQSTDTSLSERKKKKLQKRIERLQNNLRHERKNHKLYLELGDSYALLESVKDAEKHYMAAIDILQQGDVDERARKQIIVLYGKILNLDPNNYDAYTKLGQEYVATGQKEKASRFLLSSGKKAFENGDYELALQCYEQVIDLGKSNPYIIERCTEIFLKLGRKDDAIGNYVKIGDMYAREEKAVEALEYYKKASALNPESPDLTLKVARMYYTLEWTENAAAEMVKIAEYHETHQNFSDALKYYQHSLSLDRENDRALAGKLRISASHDIEMPGKVAQDEKGESQEDILEELDLIEEALKTQNFVKMEEEDLRETVADEAVPVPNAEPLVTDNSLAESSKEPTNNVIEAADIFSNGGVSAKSSNTSSDENNALEEQVMSPDEVDDFFLLDQAVPAQPENVAETQQDVPKSGAMVWQDRLLDLDLEQDFVLTTGLEEHAEKESPDQVPPFSNEAQQSPEEESETSFSETLVFEAPLTGDMDTHEDGRTQELGFVPNAEQGETDAEQFEALEFPSATEGQNKAEDVFEPVELKDEAVAEAADENPFENVQFESLQEENAGEKTELTPKVTQAPEDTESPQDEQESGASPEAEHAVENVNFDADAEKFIEETLKMEEQEAQVPTPTDHENAEEERSAEVAEKEPTSAGLSGFEETQDMPPTYTPIKKPERIPRTPFSGSVPEIKQKLEDLEKQLENTEEEKYFLQEQFTAQISKLKSRETHIKREYERARKDKDDLQHRLEEVTSIYESSRQKGEKSDEARYEAIVSKIQRKKQALQQHVDKLLKQREQNGRFLAEELKSLGSTKQRLQSNLEYIQQVKVRVEEKINTDLQQAQEEIQQLSSRAVTLEEELDTKQQSEQHLHEQFEKLQQEKNMLQDQFTETVSALTEENEKVGEELKKLSKEKLGTEQLLKKKFKALHLSHQRLRDDFKSSVQSKEMELNRTAQRLSQFADEYVKLETTLKDIRKERDKLERMLAQETATRERLEENLTDIESQVDSLEVQGSELLEQLEEELDRQLTVKQSASDEFQGSLGELEHLLALQEKEIQSLEVL